MRKLIFSISIIICLLSCSKNKNHPGNIEIVKVDSLYTVDTSYTIDDVRRYGVFPNKTIGEHPKLLKDKMEVLFELAESGVKLNFPPGVYKRTLNIEARKNIEMNFEKATFNGAINIKNSSQIKLTGVVSTLVKLYIKESDKIELGDIIIRSDTLLSGNKKRSMGCSIHAGASNINIEKLTVEDLISGIEEKYVKAALAVHGHNNEPVRVYIDSVFIKSSDRHGVYLTGENIHIDYLYIDKFGMGSSEGMQPMEGGIEGEQKEFSGLWIKKAHNSSIDKAVINIENSKATYSTNFDIGESFRPFVIDTLIVQGENKNLTTKYIKRTGVIVKTNLNE